MRDEIILKAYTGAIKHIVKENYTVAASCQRPGLKPIEDAVQPKNLLELKLFTAELTMFLITETWDPTIAIERTSGGSTLSRMLNSLVDDLIILTRTQNPSNEFLAESMQTEVLFNEDGVIIDELSR